MKDLFSLAGKTALVTGGTSGIGLMIARGLAEYGARTCIVARNAAACAEKAAELSQYGECIGIPGDLSTVAGIEAVVAAFKDKMGVLDILVNNAGTMYDAPIDEFTEDGWDQVMNLNLKSVFFMTQKCLPLLRKGATPDWPSAVINIGSVGALRVGPKENYSYQAAKAGLHHLTTSLAKRLGPEHIHVNAIAPGFFLSNMTQIPEEAMNTVLAAVPMRRVGVPGDMAGSAVFLASKAGSFVNGAILPVEGGMAI